MEMTLCCFFIWIFSGQEQKGEKKKPEENRTNNFNEHKVWNQTNLGSNFLFPKLKTYNVRKPLKIPDSQFTHVEDLHLIHGRAERIR